MRKLSIGKIAGLMAAVAMFATPQAKASLDLVFNNGNVGLAGYPGPYGTLSLNLTDTTHATVTLTAAPGFSFGDGGTLGLNLAAGTSLLGGITGNSGTGGTYALGGAGNLDGFDSFNWSINTVNPPAGSAGFNGSSTSIQFVLTTSIVGGWASEANILTPNAQGHLAAGHVYVWNGVNNGPGSGVDALTTGFSTAAVPEPTTMIAGALLLLPFGASTIRFIRKNRAA